MKKFLVLFVAVFFRTCEPVPAQSHGSVAIGVGQTFGNVGISAAYGAKENSEGYISVGYGGNVALEIGCRFWLSKMFSLYSQYGTSTILQTGSNYTNFEAWQIGAGAMLPISGDKYNFVIDLGYNFDSNFDPAKYPTVTIPSDVKLSFGICFLF